MQQQKSTSKIVKLQKKKKALMWTVITAEEWKCVRRSTLMLTFMREGSADYEKVQ